MPYYFEHNNNSEFDINKVESIQFSIDPEIQKNEIENQHGIGIISVRLE